MKKFVRKIRTSITSIDLPNIKPLYLIGAVVVLLLIVVAIALFSGGGGVIGGGDDDGSDSARGFAEGDRSRLPGADTKPSKEAPRVRSGLLDEARREGRLAVAQARGTVVSPSRIIIRVSAAPKQLVSVNWQLGCFKDRRAHLGKGQYRGNAPDRRAIELPIRGATSCIVTAGAQLTKPDGSGRVKVAVIAG